MYGFSFNIGATAFKNDLKNITCYKNLDYAAAGGGAVRNAKYEAALCAIGEAYERNGLIEYNNISNKNLNDHGLIDVTMALANRMEAYYNKLEKLKNKSK